MSNSAKAIEALVKIVRVPLDPAAAFHLFLDEMVSWWPLASHSVLGDRATGVEVTPGVGGEVTELGPDGPVGIWGTITEWEPPHRAVFDWHPGHSPEEATRLELSFRSVDGGCELRLEHDGWQHRVDGSQWRNNYDSGWDVVLAPFEVVATAT